MDANATDTMKLQLKALSAKALSAFKRQLLGIYVAEDYRDFIPEFMIHDMVGAAEINAQQWLADAVSQVCAVAGGPAAFAMIDAAMAAHLSALEGTVKLGRGMPLHPAMLKVAVERFDAVRLRLIRQVENHRLQDTRESVVVSGVLNPVADGTRRGPKGKYDWLHATNIVWGRIFRGELIPKSQKDIEEAFVSILKGDDGKLEPSNTRDYARPIWREVNRDPEDDN